MRSHTPRIAAKEELHPCPLCYRPMHNLTCTLHGAMEWCKIHKAAYPPGTHVCEPPAPPKPKTPQGQKKKRKWKSKYVAKYPPAHCVVCGVQISRGGPDTYFCAAHKAKFYGRFRYWTRRRSIETGRPNLTHAEALELIQNGSS